MLATAAWSPLYARWLDIVATNLERQARQLRSFGGADKRPVLDVAAFLHEQLPIRLRAERATPFLDDGEGGDDLVLRITTPTPLRGLQVEAVNGGSTSYDLLEGIASMLVLDTGSPIIKPKVLARWSERFPRVLELMPIKSASFGNRIVQRLVPLFVPETLVPSRIDLMAAMNAISYLAAKGGGIVITGFGQTADPDD